MFTYSFFRIGLLCHIINNRKTRHFPAGIQNGHLTAVTVMEQILWKLVGVEVQFCSVKHNGECRTSLFSYSGVWWQDWTLCRDATGSMKTRICRGEQKMTDVWKKEFKE
jgi:hypothetical protein